MKPKQEKRAEATARNSEWSAKSPKEQLAYLDRNNLTAKRQRSRIAKQLEKQT